jgi:hypothetical protein
VIIIHSCNALELISHRFYNDEKFSDVIIKFGEHEIKAHRVVLASQSRYFANAFEGRFKASANPIVHRKTIHINFEQESTLQTISLNEDDPTTLNILLKHCYGLNPINPQVVPESPDCLLRFVRAYVLAEIYQVKSLRCAASKAFDRAIRKHGLSLWNANDGEQFDTLLDQVYESLPSTQNEIRSTLARFITKKMPELRTTDESTARLRRVLESNSEFAADVVLSNLNSNGSPATAQNTELRDAATRGDVLRIQALLEDDRVDVNAVDQQQETALHWAAWGGHLEAVRLLVEEGSADMNFRGRVHNRSALGFARDRGHNAVATYLEGRGALL